MTDQEKKKKLETNAKKIVDAARRKLALELPDLLPVIYLLPMESCERPGPLWTDGETLFYHPETVARTYLENRKAIGEQLLHILATGCWDIMASARGRRSSCSTRRRISRQRISSAVWRRTMCIRENGRRQPGS